MSDADGRERQLEAENSALRAQLAAAGLTTGRGSGLDRFALDQSAPPDNPFLRPRDYPSSRFAALLPQLGYAGEGQPGLLLGRTCTVPVQYRTRKSIFNDVLEMF